MSEASGQPMAMHPAYHVKSPSSVNHSSAVPRKEF